MGDPISPRRGGHEYVWHSHILEHEEHDMMRPLVVGWEWKQMAFFGSPGRGRTQVRLTSRALLLQLADCLPVC